MSINQQRVAKLAEEIQKLTAEIGVREKSRAAVLAELNRLLGHTSDEEPVVAVHRGGRVASVARTTHEHGASSHRTLARLVNGDPLTERIVDFLSSRGDQSFRPRQIAAGLNLPRERTKSLNTTLYLLGRRGRIRKTEKGWSGLAAMRALAMGCALMMVFSFTACSNSNPPATTTTTTTTGTAAGTGSSTGHIHAITSGSSTGNSTSSSGTTGGGSTGSGETGSGSIGTGTTGEATAGATTTGTSTGGTTSGGSTTGYASGPPYSGYDAGPVRESTIDPGCTAAAPFRSTSNFNQYCVQCRTKADCTTGLQCDSTGQCVECRAANDCSSGEVCNHTCYNINVPPYQVCEVGCKADCRTAGPGFCSPGACDGDAGGCLPNECYSNSDCRVNGLGACDFTNVQYYGYGNCVACTQDAGGCGPDSLCAYNPQTGQQGCLLSCLLDAGVCGAGTYCSDGGNCVNGCQSAADCVGSSGGSICSQGQCVGCLTGATCPDYNAGCNPMEQGSGGATCGYCTSDQDCLGGGGQQHCENNPSGTYYTNQCGCHADSDCPFDAPVCVGLNPALGFPAGSGRCACTDTSQCPDTQGVQFVCESRAPFGITKGSYGSVIGGACIAPCNLDLTGTDLVGTDCATAGIGAPNPNTYYQNGPPPAANICNSATGYCVPCAQDTDCYAASGVPAVAPSCVQYAKGVDPSSGEPTGGGQCGCSDTSQCNDAWACWYPGIGGTCQPACTVVNGIDSCNPYREFIYQQPPTDPFCDTWTGGCVQCLNDYGCTNVVVNNVNGLYTYPGFTAPICNAAGLCVGCSTDSDCPSSAPNCTQGFCGFCTSNAQCYQDAGFTCMFFNGTGSAGTCTITGCVGDSNEYATDAGTLCPAGLPFCPETEVCNNQCTYPTICAACRPDGYPPNYQYYDDCYQNLPPGAYGGYCQNNGICDYYYYN